MIYNSKNGGANNGIAFPVVDSKWHDIIIARTLSNAFGFTFDGITTLVDATGVPDPIPGASELVIGGSRFPVPIGKGLSKFTGCIAKVSLNNAPLNTYKTEGAVGSKC
jgi:hypothetical protein